MNMFLFLWMSIFLFFFVFFLLSPLICFSRFWLRVPNNPTIAVVDQKAFSHRALLKTRVRGFKNQTCIWLLMASTIAHWDQYIFTLEREINMGYYHARPSGLSHLWSFFFSIQIPFWKTKIAMIWNFIIYIQWALICFLLVGLTGWQQVLDKVSMPNKGFKLSEQLHKINAL